MNEIISKFLIISLFLTISINGLIVGVKNKEYYSTFKWDRKMEAIKACSFVLGVLLFIIVGTNIYMFLFESNSSHRNKSGANNIFSPEKNKMTEATDKKETDQNDAKET